METLVCSNGYPTLDAACAVPSNLIQWYRSGSLTLAACSRVLDCDVMSAEMISSRRALRSDLVLQHLPRKCDSVYMEL